MVAKQLRTVLFTTVARRRIVSADTVWKQIGFVFEVCAVASNYPDEGQVADDGGNDPASLPFRAGGADHPAHIEARAEVRDRETYYTELRLAVHCQSRSDSAHPAIPAPRAALDSGSDTWTPGADGTSADGTSSTEGESWDELIARFGDTWT